MRINVLDMRDAGKHSATNGAFRLSGGGYRLGGGHCEVGEEDFGEAVGREVEKGDRR